MASQYVKLPLTGGGGGGGAVNSVFGRTGTVVAQANDYSAALVSVTPTGSISSTNVQDAIDEIDSDLTSLYAADAGLQTQINNKQPLDSDLTAIAALSSTGILVKTGAGTATTRTLTAGANIFVTDGGGIVGNPIISLDGVVPVANGGTGLSSTPANGKLLIGNGTNYSSSYLTAGTGIAITNGAGSITITNSAVAAFINIDGGIASTLYGGTTAIDGGAA